MAYSFSYKGKTQTKKSEPPSGGGLGDAVSKLLGRLAGKAQAQPPHTPSKPNANRIDASKYAQAYRNNPNAGSQILSSVNRYLNQGNQALAQQYQNLYNTRQQQAQVFNNARIGAANQGADTHIQTLANQYANQNARRNAASDRYTQQAQDYLNRQKAEQLYKNPLYKQFNQNIPTSASPASQRAMQAYSDRMTGLFADYISKPAPQLTVDDNGGYPDYWGGGGWGGGWGGGGGGGGGGYSADKYYNDLMLWNINRPKGS